ncbi:MAG TPA: hypothetical protein VF796_14225 [Humisphaera sp.]
MATILTSSRTFATAALFAVVASTTGGCGDVGGLVDRTGEAVPDKLRGVDVGYDVTKLFGRDERPNLPPPPVPRAERPAAEPVLMTAWWQTPDGRLHSEELPAPEAYADADRYAGAVWVKVTPIGATAAELAATPVLGRRRGTTGPAAGGPATSKPATRPGT